MESRPGEALGKALGKALGEAEVIAVAYHRAARGDAWSALVAAIADALVDLDAAERRIARQDRLISWGYARGWAGAGPGRPDLPEAPCSDPSAGLAIQRAYAPSVEEAPMFTRFGSAPTS